MEITEVLPICNRGKVVQESNVFALHENIREWSKEEHQCPIHLCPLHLLQMIWLIPFTFSDYVREKLKGHYQATFHDT